MTRVDRPATSALDARLALGAGAAWLALAVCLSRSVTTNLVVAAMAGLLGVVARLVARRGVGWASAAALGLFCIALVLFPFAGRLVHIRATPLAQLARAHASVTVELTVTGDPRPLAATGLAGAPRAAISAAADAVTVAGRTTQVGGRLLVLGPAAQWRSVLPGQRARVEGVLQPPLSGDPTTAALFVQTQPTLIGRPPWWQRAAGGSRVAAPAAAGPAPRR